MAEGQDVYKVCIKLQELGFPQIRRDDSWYFVRPDMLIPLTEVNILYGVDRRPYGYDGERSLFNELVYFPSEKELEIASKPTQIVYTQRSGVMAYKDKPDGDGGIAADRGEGVDLWHALADLYIKMHPDSQ